MAVLEKESGQRDELRKIVEKMSSLLYGTEIEKQRETTGRYLNVRQELEIQAKGNTQASSISTFHSLLHHHFHRTQNPHAVILMERVDELAFLPTNVDSVPIVFPSPRPLAEELQYWCDDTLAPSKHAIYIFTMELSSEILHKWKQMPKQAYYGLATKQLKRKWMEKEREGKGEIKTVDEEEEVKDDLMDPALARIVKNVVLLI